MRVGAGRARFGVARRVMCALAGAALACLVGGCASAYEKSLREMALPGDERLERRVQELVECAEHAVGCLERAASWYASRGGDAPEATDAHERLLVNDCESAVFEFSRRALSVGDVAPGAGPETEGAVAQLQGSIAASGRSLEAAVVAIKGAMDGVSTESVGAAVGEARDGVSALERDARAITAG